MKTKLDIEMLLQWAYRDELPKRGEALRGASMQAAWDPVSEYGERLAAIDETPEPGFVYGGEPHLDAEAIHRAVISLRNIEPDWYVAGADLVPEGSEFVDGRFAMQKALHHASALVMTHARCGTRPKAEAVTFSVMPERDPLSDKPRVHVALREIRDGKGRVVRRDPVEATTPGTLEAEGYDPKAKRPRPWSYCRIVWLPSPEEVALERAEYSVWRAALDLLAEELAGQLAAHEPLPSRAPWRPWEGEVGDLQRVLESKSDLNREVSEAKNETVARA